MLRTSGKTSECVTSNSKAHTLRCGAAWPTLLKSIHNRPVGSLEHFVDPLHCGPLRSSLTTHQFRLVIHQVVRADGTELKFIWLFACY